MHTAVTSVLILQSLHSLILSIFHNSKMTEVLALTVYSTIYSNTEDAYLSRAKKHLRQSKLVITLIKPQRFKESLQRTHAM